MRPWQFCLPPFAVKLIRLISEFNAAEKWAGKIIYLIRSIQAGRNKVQLLKLCFCVFLMEIYTLLFFFLLCFNLLNNFTDYVKCMYSTYVVIVFLFFFFDRLFPVSQSFIIIFFLSRVTVYLFSGYSAFLLLLYLMYTISVQFFLFFYFLSSQ